MLQDIPLLAEVRKLIRYYKAVGKDAQLFYNYLGQAASPHEFAAGLIAIRIETGSFGYGASGEQRNRFITQAYDLAARHYDDVVANLHRGFEKKVSRNSYNDRPVVTDLGNILVLSDKARSEQRAWRIENGSEYKGCRTIRAAVNHDNGIYGKLAGQNVVYYRK